MIKFKIRRYEESICFDVFRTDGLKKINEDKHFRAGIIHNNGNGSFTFRFILDCIKICFHVSVWRSDAYFGRL